jgi:hypothetical protein
MDIIKKIIALLCIVSLSIHIAANECINLDMAPSRYPGQPGDVEAVNRPVTGPRQTLFSRGAEDRADLLVNIRPEYREQMKAAARKWAIDAEIRNELAEEEIENEE